MLGYLIKTVLVLFVGYVYPAFKCFKVLERNNEGIQGLSFWCKYWIIVALATVLEKFNEIISLRFPMLAELKPLFFMFLWHRRTQGAEIIYERLLRPWIVINEAEIEDKLERIMSGELLLFYIKNFTGIGQSRFLEPIRHFISNSQSNTSNQTISPPEIVRPEPTAPPLPGLRRGFEHLDDPNIYQLYWFSDDEHPN